jgi:hypothetical protein
VHFVEELRPARGKKEGLRREVMGVLEEPISEAHRPFFDPGVSSPEIHEELRRLA